MDSGFGINSLSRDEMTSDKFDYWSPIVFENGIKKSYDIELRPQSVGNDGPYEFNFQVDNKKFIDMSNWAWLTIDYRPQCEYKNKEQGIERNRSNSLEFALCHGWNSKVGYWCLKLQVPEFFPSPFQGVIIYPPLLI